MYVLEIKVEDTFVYYKVRGYEAAVSFASRIEALGLGTVRITTEGVSCVSGEN